MKIKIVNIAILLVTVFGTLLALSTMPDTVPVHFNFQGVADRWGSKYEMLITTAVMALMLALWFGCDAYYRRQIRSSDDEKKLAEARANMKVLNVTFTAISVMFMLLDAAFLYLAYTQLEGAPAAKIDILGVVCVLIGITFVVLGNIMPKSRSNALFGFRLPWTRFNDITWQKCNRFGGIAFVISGLVTALCGALFGGTVSLVVMLFSTALLLIIMIIYSYLIYSDEVKKAK